MQNRRN
jgi:hypothetical protein